jgi:hypothetical protein
MAGKFMGQNLGVSGFRATTHGEYRSQLRVTAWYKYATNKRLCVCALLAPFCGLAGPTRTVNFGLSRALSLWNPDTPKFCPMPKQDGGLSARSQGLILCIKLAPATANRVNNQSQSNA